MKRRVAITGIGPVTSIGIGKDCFFENILRHETRISAVPEEFEKNYSFKSRHFVPAPDFSLSEFGIPRSLENAMEKISKFSVAGAKLALEDGGFQINSGERYFQTDLPESCDIVLGVGMSSLQTAFHSYLSHMSHMFGGEKVIREEHDIKTGFHRMVIPMLMPNAASAWISILFGIRGTNYTINTSCASGTCAIGEAYRRIVSGCCDVAITGGVECLEEKNGAIMRGFDMLGTLTRSPGGNPMPFSKERSGFLFNAGAGCILVLEDLTLAQKRGALIYAEICDYGSNSEAFNIVQMDKSGKQISEVLRKLVQNHKIDYINAHGTGTITNDEIEARVIQEIFGNSKDQPLVNSTKGILGHSIGASGAVEAGVTALSLYYGKVHGNIIDHPMDNLNLVLESREAEINYGISASYGFGGHNGAILLKRYDESHE
ncbi:MAG: beta-ketoacyl-[acyl-carrier-protein] synthase family protein [Dehalobacterium sp.]